MSKSVSDRELNYLTSQLVSKINDKIDNTNVVEEATPYKILKLDGEGKFPANILSGIIPMENIPKGALERCIIVADDDERFALRSNEVQVGDTVKVTATNKMFYVKDDDQLYSEEGYEIYSSGSAEKLTIGRNIIMTGDGEGYAEFDGTKDVSINLVITGLSGAITLSKENYGDQLPTDVYEGRMFLRKVEGASVSIKVITLDPDMYGDELPPTDNLNENDIYFLEL